MFNPEEFGRSMGQMAKQAIAEAVEPLQRRISDLEQKLAQAADHARMISEEVAKQVAKLPAPKDGVPGLDGQNGKDGATGSQGEKGEAGEQGLPGPQGVAGEQGERGVAGALGRDGNPGQDGKSFGIEDAEALLRHHWSAWELEFERRAAATLEKAVERMPKPADGADGQDGADGLGFDDLQVEHDGGRRVSIKFVRCDRVKAFDFDMPVVIDRGIYKEGNAYMTGDGVTWGGSYWIAQSETKSKPDGADSGWRLAVKKGRDGKDGRNGIDKTAPVRVEG